MKAPVFERLAACGVMFLAVIGAATSAWVGAEAVSPEMVQQLERARTDALRAGDAAALQRILGSDYSEVDPLGRVHTRHDAMAITRDAPEPEKVRIVVRGNAAIVVGRERDTRIMRVWIREGDTWHLMAQQATRIQPGLPAVPPAPEVLAAPRIISADDDDRSPAGSVLAAQNALDVANALSDVAAFSRLTAADFVLVTNHGLVRTKADRLVEQGVRRLERAPRAGLAGRDDLRVRMYGTTAIVTARSWPMNNDGRPATPTRFTRVWMTGAPGWQQVANIITSVTAP